MGENTPQLIPGYHSVKEALLSKNMNIKEIWISKGRAFNRASEISRLGHKKGIPVHLKDSRDMDRLIPETAHQGFVAVIHRFNYTALEGLTDKGHSREKYSLIIGMDHITDEGNLGGLLRTSAFFGAGGVILPKNRSAQITQKVMKRSSGACFLIPITRVVNMGRALDIFNRKGFWIVGASSESDKTIYDFDWNRHTVLILGSEDKGLSLPVKKRCHQMVAIPGEGNVESLNVAVAGGIILSEIIRQRKRSI